MDVPLNLNCNSEVQKVPKKVKPGIIFFFILLMLIIIY